MLRREFSTVLGVAIAAAMALASATAHAAATKLDLRDACLEWGPAFCAQSAQGQVSDIPAYLTGNVVFYEDFRPPSGDPVDILRGSSQSRPFAQMLTVMINRSEPDALHKVFICGAGGTAGQRGGFTGCLELGTFTTNKHGHGHFHWKFGEEALLDGCKYDVLAINSPSFATVVATPKLGDLFPCHD